MMLAILFIVLIATGLEVPGLVKNKMWRELIAYSGLMLVGIVLAVLQLEDIPVPNPNNLVEAVFKPFVQWIMNE